MTTMTAAADATTTTTTTTPPPTPSLVTPEANDIVEDDFVVIDPKNELKLEKHRASFFTQMETFLNRQIELCDHYKRYFEQQHNDTMTDKFANYGVNTGKDLELLRKAMQTYEILPKWRFDIVKFNCVPTNVDVREKELQLSVRVSHLPVPKDSETYIVAEFSFPKPGEGNLTGLFSRWYHNVKIEPKNVLCCTKDEASQLDTVRSTDSVSFLNPSDEFTEYERPLSFYVDKGKSRTLKRKFKPIKLTFYEKTTLLSCDKKLGTVQVRIDNINDENSLKTRLAIMDGRKQTEALADVRVRVREALVEKSIRAHEEKLLVLF